ncbi:plasmid pRiA4b ORF-3 family protein, partial [Rhizobium sp. PDO1-076]
MRIARLTPQNIRACVAINHLDDPPPTLFIWGMFKAPNAVQIRVSIDEIQPDVWRRLVLPVHWNLEQLHLGIQAAFNWWNYHLYEFLIGGLRYGEVAILTEGATDDDPRVFDQTEVRLLDFKQDAVFRE